MVHPQLPVCQSNSKSDDKRRNQMENQNQNKTVSDVPTIMLRDRNTTYVIGLNFSRSSRETYADKANRLIRNDVKAGNF